MPDEKRISPAVAIIPVALGLAAVVGIAALAWAKAAPPIPPEDIVLSDLIVSPSEVYAGEPVSISVVATNIGETTGSYEITCEVI
ncbi:hypothetical protein ES703_124854 [subsurface metagenome]